MSGEHNSSAREWNLEGEFSRMNADGDGDTPMSDAQHHGSEGAQTLSSNSVQSPEYITINTQFSPGQLGGHSFTTPPTNSVASFGSQIVIESSPGSASQHSSASTGDSQSLAPMQPAVGSPGRKHPLADAKAGEGASNSKRLKLDQAEEVSGSKVGLATLLNPEPDPKAKSGRSRILFKCAVCLDMPDPAVFVHPCGHVFCEVCAQGAVQTTMRCPVCRHSIRLRDIRVLQFRVAKVGR
ncbi:hypothetical protein IWW55_003729 [Coemansia sp. RSA 2706]|nr:hypothetical protein LPJ70_000795 [Coemansia sp. RSA 2708]KAJ2301604.1 hypothetical protein IWW55_003729 [Coemansia sp. RSA 2706]KAJ2324349.1 hypothetical protein IWW51_003317 [Coemansia sp. RSA 2702]KAJ2367723.1 hypothetical protein H4S01_001994 [Coemansia sp. RSA 2610]